VVVGKIFYALKKGILKRPGFYILLIILVAIVAATIKPGFYLLGWDNYSSYFNLPNNLFQTFFATWREYRGLGVPSDSESTDLFRQIFYFVLHIFTPEKLLDQIYNCFALLIGCVSMYFLGSQLCRRISKDGSYIKYADWFGLFSALFYLFNISSLSTFYFPMIMYVNRFFMLPVVFLSILILVRNTFTRKLYIFAILAFLFCSGAFLTATIFIVLMMGLFLYGLSSENFKKYSLVLILFVITQLFWILPFFNYTLQKSKIIPLAPAFISTNEIQLNKAQNYYSLDKAFTFYPSFFDTQFNDISSAKQLYFHPMANLFNNPFVKGILLIFPVLYILGSIIILARYKKFRVLLWVPATIIIFIFLTLKEFSFLGFLYHFFDTHVPYFGILFRFGDTKFHPMVAFAGSIAAALSLIEIYRFSQRKGKYLGAIIIGLVLILTVGVFNYYFRGYLISPYKYVDLPDAYKEIATTINSDHDNFRVLQLPTGKEDYWKSYKWGMFGSSFLNFMLDHPLVDKTFEPASMENVALDDKIDKDLANFQLIADPSMRKDKAREFADLLQETGVKYLIYDNSVSSSLYPRGILLWQRFNGSDSEAMVKEMMLDGYAKEVGNYKIDLTDYANSYAKFGNLSIGDGKALEKNKKTYVSLIQIKSPQKQVSFIKNANNLDPNINFMNTSLFSSANHFTQEDNSSSFVSYPFATDNQKLSSDNKSFTFSVPVPYKKAEISVPQNSYFSDSSTHFVDIYAKQDESFLTLSFVLELSPGVNGSDPTATTLTSYQIPTSKLVNQNKESNLSNYISDWAILENKNIGALRVRVGDYVIPLPVLNSPQPKKIGTVALQGNNVPLEILEFDQEKTVDSKDIVITQNPNCFRDKLSDASFNDKKNGSEINITSQNQSLCYVVNLDKVLGKDATHAEVNINAIGNSEDLDSKYVGNFPTSKSNLTSFISSLPKPNLLRICVKQPNTNDCYNLHQFANVEGKINVTFPLEHALGDLSDMQLLLALKNTGYQKQNIDIKKMTVDTFTTKASTNLTIPDYSDFSTDLPDVRGNIQLTVPKALSLYSFYFDPKKEGLYGLNPACETNKGYRTFRNFKGNLISYDSNCYYEFYTNVPFSSSNFSLFDVSYNLLSGKFPRLIVDDGFYKYADSFLSLDQGYPNIEGFKLFQTPENLTNKLSRNDLTKKLENLKMQDAYSFIGDSPELDDNGNKNVTFHQDSENEGMTLVSGLSIIPLPNQWKNIKISPSSSVETNYQLPESFLFKRISPSFWKVEVKGNGKMLLKFNEAYDKQWKAYDSRLGVFFGLGNSYQSVKCDGYANCFTLNPNGQKIYYIFYTPERLSILGWILAAVGIIIFAFILKRLSGFRHSDSGEEN
jgi:hypothetical protein